MRASIRDKKALSEVSPGSLSAYARTSGWSKTDDIYGDHSDVYAAAELPEIILPRHQRLGDYASVVSRLIEIFARVAETDELTLYRDLVTADRDVIRIRSAESNDGSVAASDGINLIRGAHDMLLAAACSLRNPQPLYRAGANREASDYLRRVRLGQTEHGSFVITLLTPVVPPRIQQVLIPEWGGDDPIERQMTKRLADALEATRDATESTVGGDANAFSKAVKYGVSANLCEALIEVILPFETLDISLTWARTRPMNRVRDVIRFAAADAPILCEAARSFRDREPRPDVSLFGVVRTLKREEAETDGTVTLRASIEGQNQSVMAVLKQTDYEQAILAHKEKTPVVMKGDLERLGQRWRLLNPSISDIIRDEGAPNESE